MSHRKTMLDITGMMEQLRAVIRLSVEILTNMSAQNFNKFHVFLLLANQSQFKSLHASSWLYWTPVQRPLGITASSLNARWRLTDHRRLSG